MFFKNNQMSADKRAVHTDALATLGTIIETGERDAIHLAVEPIIAAENLYPGQHIGIVDGKATTKADKKLGIVDPFISGFVPQGQKFWLIVYPRQITSLRHVWSHPDFEVKEPAVEDLSDPVSLSTKWIADFADKIRQHPKSLMNAAYYWLESGEYTYDNSESYKDHWEEFPEFWEHYEIVTNTKVEENKRESFFTCSC